MRQPFFKLVLASLVALALTPTACTEKVVVVKADAGEETPGDDAGGGGGADGEAGVLPDGPESCDPYAPRVRTPEVFVGPTGLTERMVGLIDGAKSSIDLMMYEFDVEEIYTALVAAQKRGVKVRVVLDSQQRNNVDARKALIDAGVELTDAITEFPHYHVKVLIVDRAQAVVMSANFNAYSVRTERNYGVILTGQDDIEDLEAVMNHDLKRGPKVFDLGCSRLVVSPINARSEILKFIKGAKKTLDFAAMYISDFEVQEAIKAAQASGVKVRVLFADPRWMDGNAKTATDFAAAKIEVRYFSSFDLHAKLMMSESAAFVGSENYSANSLDNNREVGVVVTDGAPLGTIRAQFEEDWGAGSAAP